MKRDGENPPFEILIGGEVVARVPVAPTYGPHGIGRPALRDWLAQKKRSRFRLIAGGVPEKPLTKTEDQ